ncbi:MAG: PilZ domain-containing protein [SAR324 cluster bacterium]|nr:PilZ domain-containing protein [SAR324 cluster bacterium]
MDIESEIFSDEPDRRENERIGFENPFTVTVQGQEISIDASGEDISATGVKFFCKKAFSEDDVISVQLTEQLFLKAEVKFVTEVKEEIGGWDAEKNIPIPADKMEGFQVCAAFLDLTEEEKTELRLLMSNLVEADI